MSASDITIRDERPEDADTLHTLTYDAFLPMTFSDNSEAEALRRMRADGDLTLSLVMEKQGEIIGHVAFSPLWIDAVFDTWYGLGPISIRADHQKQGHGRALIAHGLEQLRSLGAEGCALIGNPAVYAGSGFISDGRFSYQDLPSELVQFVQFSGRDRQGVIQFSPGLESTS